jgi:hypothetical protein
MIAVPARSVTRRLRAAFTERLWAKLAAVLLALALWLVVTLQAPLDRWVEVQLDLSVDSGYALAEPAPKLRALVSGRGRDVIELLATKPEAHMEAADAGNETAVIAFAPSDIELPAGVEGRVRDVRPHLVRIKLRRVP